MDEQPQSHWLVWMMSLVGVILIAGLAATVWLDLPWPNVAQQAPPPAKVKPKPQPIPSPPPAKVVANRKPPAPSPVPVRKTAPKRRKIQAANPASQTASNTSVRRFGTIAYPAARVLDEPDHGDMIGRIEPGQRVEIMAEAQVAGSVVDPTWYRINFHGSPGWISRISLTHPPVAEPSEKRTTRVQQKENPWTSVSAGLVNDYRGKILRVEFLDATECRVHVDKDMAVEDARQTSENIGYYLVNATGKTPRVLVLMERLQIAVATSDGERYVGVIDIRERGAQ